MSDWDDTPEGAPGWLAAAEPEEPNGQQRRGRRDIDGKDRHLYKVFRARVRQRAAAERAVCWICHGPVNYALKYPDPLSWSLDHEDPIVTRPDRALDAANARSSHLRCNQLRGASGGLEMLDEGIGSSASASGGGYPEDVTSRPAGWTPGDPEWNPELGCWPSEDWEAL